MMMSNHRMCWASANQRLAQMQTNAAPCTKRDWKGPNSSMMHFSQWIKTAKESGMLSLRWCCESINEDRGGECKSGNGRRNKLPLQRRAFITAKIEKDSWPSSSPRSWSEWWNAYRMPNMVATDNESHPSRSTMHSIKLRTWGIYFSRVEVENFAINRKRTWSAKWESVTDDNTGLTETTQLHSSIHKVSARARCLEWMDCWMMKFLGLFLNDGEFFCDGAGNKGKNGLAQGCC